jgi:hypothetical protein
MARKNFAGKCSHLLMVWASDVPQLVRLLRLDRRVWGNCNEASTAFVISFKDGSRFRPWRKSFKDKRWLILAA